MGDPRWTVVDEVNGDASVAYWRTPRGLADIAIWTIEGYIDEDAAHAALVQCVRDADTLRKARALTLDLAGALVAPGVDGTSALLDLLDLLTQDDE